MQWWLFVLLCFFVLDLCGAKGWKRSEMPKEKPHYFQQKLDHFNPEDNRTFTQKFYFDPTYWKTNIGPIFLYISGEGPCEGTPNNYLVDVAQQFSGLIVTMEHRYYGESIPFDEFTTENLAYLSSKQAIYDLAYFITYFSENYSNSSMGWFTVGCSYAGALSAWFRLKFPHLTKGSWSSSGVVNAVLDFTAFDEQIATSAGPVCADLLRQTTKQIENMVYQDANSNSLVKHLFQADNFEDGDFFYLTADAAAESVQYGFQDQLCGALQDASNKSQTLLEAFANYTTQFFYTVFGGPDGYRTSVQQDITAPNADRTWWFQKCSEVAYFQNAPEQNSIRSSAINMTWHKLHCEKVFKMKLFPDTDDTNNYYGGKNIQGTRIFFADSSQDPWQHASVDNSPNNDEPYNFVECHNCGHCSEMRGCPSVPGYGALDGCDNMDNVNAVRQQLLKWISIWLSD